MKDQKLKFTTLATFSDFESTLNPSFHKARLRIMAIGSKAHNDAKFSHDGTMKALPTLKNIPLVTQYDRNTKNLKSHEFEDDGNALTYGIGVIAESCQQWIEEVEVDGETKEYLCSEVLLWKRQKREYDFIKKHRDLNVSMEVMMNRPKRAKDGSVEVEDFYFTAVTVLGVGVNPAFGEANLVFAKDGDDYQQMMFELNQFENGGNTMPEDNQVQTTENQTVVENEGQEPQVVEPTQENVVVNNEPEVDKTKVDDVDYKAKFEEMEAELSRTIVELTKERDDLTTQLQQAQDDMQSKMSALQQELDELKQYKSQIEKDKLDAERQTVLDQFSDLQDTDEYKELVENLGDLTPKALEDKLYIIAGRIARQNRKTQKQQIKPKLNIATPTSNEEVPNFKFANFLMK
ncbi:MAG: hypothetical protein ACLUSV_00130 [Streptococcus sp.]